MANIIQGGTYIVKAPLPRGLNLANTVDVYVSFGKGKQELFTVKDPIFEDNIVIVKLTQEQSLSLPVGDVLVQLNWTYMCGGEKKRQPTPLGTLKVGYNIYDRVM